MVVSYVCHRCELCGDGHKRVLEWSVPLCVARGQSDGDSGLWS